MTTADGLKTIIQIAKGKIGEDAFPEEFAHVMIAGLGNHNLVKRLMNTLDDFTVEQILGEQYEAYNTKYKGDKEMLRKEAAGKLLTKHLKGEPVASTQKSLIRRIWDYIKSIFSTLSDNVVNISINEANEEAGKLAQYIMNEDISEDISDKLILNEKPLYDLSTSINNMETITEEALSLLSKRVKIITARGKNKMYSKRDYAVIKQLQELIEKKKYTKGCLHFLNEVIDQMDNLQKEFKRLKDADVRSDSNINKIRRTSYILRQIKEFSEAYDPIVKQLIALPSMLESDEIEISEEDATQISELASRTNTLIININKNYKNLRFDTVYNFLNNYWSADYKLGKNMQGEQEYITIKERDAEGNLVDKKTDVLSLGLIMKMAFKDINWLDKMVSSMSDASDPLLSLVGKVVKTAHRKRDRILNDILSGVRASHKKLIAAGYNTEFMFERDKNGKLTGRLISNIDFDKFNKARNAYIKSLKEDGLTKYEIEAKVEVWESNNMESVYVEGSNTERQEIRPKISLYGKNGLAGLSSEQLNYYNAMMQVKAALEDLIPSNYSSTYNAVQISKDMTEAVMNNLGNPKKAVQLMLSRAQSKFMRKIDDSEFGEEAKDANSVLLDFAGNPIEKIPIYYTSPLEDTEMLSTDFTSSILAYAGMAVNYGEMNKIIDALELTRDLIKDREVQQTSGDAKLAETFKVLGKEFRKAYTKPGATTRIGERIDSYYASVVYGKNKKDQGTIAGTNIDNAKTLDSLKFFTGAVGLGLNTFSAITNVTVGKMQIFIEACSGEYFGYKNAAVGKKNYYKDLPAYLAELNATQKSNKMALLINRFDALEDFYSNLKNNGYYKSNFSKIIGNANLFILNNLGEHYLHTRTMLAILDRVKVKKGSQEISLYDALEVKQYEDGSYYLGLIDGVTETSDGKKITEEYLDNLALKIGRVNQSLNGAFNEDDKGAIHRYALGRLAMQFRQWMPAHYYRRFARKYYDPILEQEREGYHITMGKFIWETVKDMSRAKFQLATRFRNLSNHERANLRRSISEIGIFALLTVALSMLGPAKDHKGVWYKRWLSYCLQRMKLEAGASVPITPSFLENIWSILKSPAPAIKSFNNIADILWLPNIFNEIESGRYKGWNRYMKDLVELIPIYGQINKVIDINTEDYMFTVLNTSN